MRYPIIPLRILEIKNSSYFEGSAENKLPSFIVTKMGEKVVRCGIVGTLVDKYVNEDLTYSRLIICDDTSDIILKCFGELVNESLKIDLGNIVFAYGKVREYNYRYIRAEFIKKVDFVFESFFKLKIIDRIKRNSNIVKEILKLSEILNYEEILIEAKKRFELEEIQVKEILKLKSLENLEDKILEIIKSFSSEDGVSESEILSILNIEKDRIERVIRELLNSGKIYEYAPGKYRIIE
ncbi:MAG: hypothetical protein QXS69_00485 [Candidatus Aenigmatarchaeota archaeon]